jgi:SRSO17 transposase
VIKLQLTKTEYNPELLEKWKCDTLAAEKISEILQEYLAMFNVVFNNSPRIKNFGIYIKGLLSKLKRKPIEPIALEYMGESGVRTLQNFVSRSNFEDKTLLESYQIEVSREINSANGMLSVDPSEFVKKGKRSAGVKRQYCGRLGKIENCQSVVFAAYSGEKGYGIVDRELYIPEEWFNDSHIELRGKCGIPSDKKFQTKNAIALEMITKIASKNLLNIKWFGCDAALGCDHKFIDSLPKSAYYFVGVPNNERVFLPNETSPVLVKTLCENDNFSWERVGFDGSKGLSYSNVKIIRCKACRVDSKGNPVQHHNVWLYIRQYENGDTKYFLTDAPENILPQELHEAVTLRWPIEQCFEECKSQLGMADFEGRSYNGFMRHLLFVMIAHFFATNLRLELKKTAFL